MTFSCDVWFWLASRLLGMAGPTRTMSPRSFETGLLLDFLELSLQNYQNAAVTTRGGPA
jgi:hypothetical protein